MSGFDDVLVSITHFTPERFAAQPQVGLAVTQEWGAIRQWLTSPSVADDKRAAGAWCPCALEGGVVKEGTGPMSLLVFDVDQAGPGGIDRSARALARYHGVIAPTFSATRENEKHRIVLLPSRPLEPAEFRITWPWMRRALELGGLVIDKGCKNLNRLYFACVARSLDTWLGRRELDGALVDVESLLDCARQELADEEEERQRRLADARPVADENRDRYIAGACEAARGNVAGAGEGGRHDTLFSEAFSLARLGLSEADIRGELLEVFVVVAGERRRREGECAIRDAVAARHKRGAA
jgi:hypothetical protein